MRFIIYLFFLLLSCGCGFHLVNVENYSLNIDKINPATERQIIASSQIQAGLIFLYDKKYVIKDLKYNIKFIANRNAKMFGVNIMEASRLYN